MRVLLLTVALAAPCFAQGLHFGLKVGVPATEYFETGRISSAEYSAATRRYTFGVAAEWRATRTAGVEFDALYKRMGYVGIVTFFSNGISTTSEFDAKGNSWEFPLLAKYRFGRAVRPFVAGGGVLRYIGPVRARGQVTVVDLVARTTTHAPIDTKDPSDLRKRVYPGLVAAGGVEAGVGRLRVLPELRYTHWTANIAGAGGVLRFAPNQVEFLLGLLF